MAITIHYKGKLSSIASVNQLNSEVSEIGRALKWKPVIVNDYSARKKYIQYEDLVGMTMRPAKCDLFSLTFLTDGTMMGAMYAALGNIKEVLFDEEYQVKVKTQYAGADVHIAILKLLRYLEKKYFESFELVDETGYWETGDEALARSKFPVPYVDEEEEQKEISPFDRKNSKVISVAESMEQLLVERWKTVD